MKISWSRFIKYLCCAAALVCMFAAMGRSDVGDFNDYDSGSSWSSSSSDSWGSSSSGSDHGSSGSRELDLNNPLDVLMLLFFIVFFIVAITQSFKKANAPSKHLPNELKWPDLANTSYRQAEIAGLGKLSSIPDNTTDITRALQETDPAFNATAFLEWAKEVFFKLQYAWMERDWEQVRPFESEELFATHARQLNEYKRLGRINMLERINVNNAYFFSLIKDKEWETLSVVLHVRMIDYIIDEHSRRVLKGSPDKDCFMSYFYIFKRKEGVKTTSAKQATDTIACPNCGAPTHVVSSGKCEYCNFVITVKDHGWVLTDIIGIKPPYNYGAGGVFIQNKPEE